MGVNPDSSAALYPPPFSRPDDSNGASASSSAAATSSATSTSNSANSSADAPPSSDSQPAPFSASTIASLFPSLHRSASLSAHSAAASASAPPSSLSPFLSRQLSTSRPSSNSGSDWRTSVTIEDRLQQRSKIRESYLRQCGGSLAVLLELVQAVEEELLFAGSGSRLDYFKAAIDFEARLRIKKQQLGLAPAAAATDGAGGSGGITRIAVSTEDNGGVKRERQQEGQDKKMADELGAEEDDDDVEAGEAEGESEPSSKKQRS